MGGQHLLITSKSRVLRPSSDYSKDETHMIFSFMNRQNTPIYSNISEQTQDRQNITHLKTNDPETLDNIDVMNICHPEK